MLSNMIRESSSRRAIPATLLRPDGFGKRLGMAEAKTKPTTSSPRDFIGAIADPTRRADATELARIFERATGEKPVMWGAAIIGFGKYRYRYESGHEGEMCLAGFSPRSAAFSLYVLSGAKGEGDLLARLGKFSRSKSCLQVKRVADIDPRVLEELVRASAAHTRAVKQCDVCADIRATSKAARAKKIAAKPATERSSSGARGEDERSSRSPRPRKPRA